MTNEEKLKSMAESIKNSIQNHTYNFATSDIEEYKKDVSKFLDVHLPLYNNEIVADGKIMKIYLERKKECDV